MAQSVQETSKSPVYAGSISVTTTPVALPALQPGQPSYGHELRELFLQADVNNTDDIMIGNAGNASGPRLHPDDDFVIPLETPQTLYAVAASGTQILRYLGRD